VSRSQKGKTTLDFTEARDSEWQWHQLGRMQVYTSLQTDNRASTLPLSFYGPTALKQETDIVTLMASFSLCSVCYIFLYLCDVIGIQVVMARYMPSLHAVIAIYQYNKV